MASKTSEEIISYKHSDKRINNPEAGSVRPETDSDLNYEFAEYSREPHDPNLDPHLGLSYTGKTYQPMQVETRSLHIHEHINTISCLENVKKYRATGGQPSMFGTPSLPAEKAIEFYKHDIDWENRMIAGDSLLVMNSLLQREQMAGKVQTIYFDPPYGMNYNSNFQPFTNNKNVGDQDLSTESEMVKAFRDTWELGIHSYLTYMRDRLHLCRELLTDQGSIFVQIGDENFARVCLLLDEVFGAKNRVTMITYQTTGSSSSAGIPDVCSYLLWYAKNKKEMKYVQLYEELNRKEIIELYSWHAKIETSNGKTRSITKDESANPEIIPKGDKIFCRRILTSQGWSETGRSEPYEYKGRVFTPRSSEHWSVSHEGLDALVRMGRLDDIEGTAKTLAWKEYETETPGKEIHNNWAHLMRPSKKRFVVETSPAVIERCILMTSDPGDIVLDPTCGSGTTAFVAEQWGRRWITCDTSRVALTLAKERLSTAVYDYYELADEKNKDVSKGFVYKTVPYVSAATLAYDEDPTPTVLYDQPNIPKGKRNCRVSGPFTFEALPAPLGPTEVDMITCEEAADTADYYSMIEDLLIKQGIMSHSNGNVLFRSLRKLPHGKLQSVGELENGQIAAVFIAQKHSSMSKTEVEIAIQEAQNLVPEPDVLFFVAQSFSGEAQTAIDEKHWPGKNLRRALIDSDIFMQDLKGAKGISDSPFWIVGQPDIDIRRKEDGRYVVEVLGFDYFNPMTGECTNGGTQKIAVWYLDANYDGRTMCPSQIFFTQKNGWDKLAKNLKAYVDADLIKQYSSSVSLPFEAGDYKRAAVKVVDDRGVESMRIIRLEEGEM